MDLSPGDQLHHGEDDPLLVDLPKGSDAGGGSAAYVDVVAAVAQVAHQLPPVEKRGDEEYVVQVARLPVRVVDHQHVARLQIPGAVFPDCARDQAADGDQVRRLAEGLGHHPALGVHEGAGIVEPGLDVGGEGAALNGDRHFLGGLHQRVSNHLEEDGVEFSVAGCRAPFCRNPHFSPGGVTIAQDFRRQRVLATESVVVPTFEGACAR